MEEWRPVVGYENLYMVSNMGRVKSLNYNKTGKERILKPQKSGNGYLHVQLCKDGKAKNYLVHRLVATAFCDNPHGFKEVNHKDEDKTNNCADNLEFCNGYYNCNYGTRNNKVAEKNINNPKTSKPVFGIDKVTGLIVEFPSAHEAERVLRIDQSSITKCCKGKKKSIGGFYWYYADSDTE